MNCLQNLWILNSLKWHVKFRKCYSKTQELIGVRIQRLTSKSTKFSQCFENCLQYLTTFISRNNFDVQSNSLKLATAPIIDAACNIPIDEFSSKKWLLNTMCTPAAGWNNFLRNRLRKLNNSLYIKRISFLRPELQIRNLIPFFIGFISNYFRLPSFIIVGK